MLSLCLIGSVEIALDLWQLVEPAPASGTELGFSPRRFSSVC